MYFNVIILNPRLKNAHIEMKIKRVKTKTKKNKTTQIMTVIRRKTTKTRNQYQKQNADLGK